MRVREILMASKAGKRGWELTMMAMAAVIDPMVPGDQANSFFTIYITLGFDLID